MWNAAIEQVGFAGSQDANLIADGKFQLAFDDITAFGRRVLQKRVNGIRIRLIKLMQKLQIMGAGVTYLAEDERAVASGDWRRGDLRGQINLFVG